MKLENSLKTLCCLSRSYHTLQDISLCHFMLSKISPSFISYFTRYLPLSFPGVVVPVGGSKDGDCAEIPIIPGDSFVDGPSGKLVRVHSGFVSRNEVKPSAGGYQSLLDATVLACEARALDTLREYKDAVHSAGKLVFAFPGLCILSQCLWYCP